MFSNCFVYNLINLCCTCDPTDTWMSLVLLGRQERAKANFIKSQCLHVCEENGRYCELSRCDCFAEFSSLDRFSVPSIS